MVIKSALIFFHKILSRRKPSHFTSKIRMPRSQASAKPALLYNNKSSEFDRTTLKKGLSLYNTIPDDLKKLWHNNFKKKIRDIYFKPPWNNTYMRGRGETKLGPPGKESWHLSIIFFIYAKMICINLITYWSPFECLRSWDAGGNWRS